MVGVQYPLYRIRAAKVDQCRTSMRPSPVAARYLRNMCGRFTLSQSPERVAEAFGLTEVPEFPPRYNIAPSQPVGVILQNRDSGAREFRLMVWGLIPAWVKDPSKFANLINARSETAAEKPSFRAAYKYRRCLIPADGFYEWQKVKSGSKQPFLFTVGDRSLFAFAGLWESWNDIETCTILTTAANPLLRTVHDRMPVILNPEDYARWLDPTPREPQQLSGLLQPFPDKSMQAISVSTRINFAKVDDAQCIEPLQAS
ncbi:SOS response-associated peptidase [Altericista sp. CCNU0014]|uniref:SOS response-associated peptidase n=1 Tax=Altericista sp. CCNU0014 TaxID=3082949 RepID=UPI00384FEF3C